MNSEDEQKLWQRYYKKRTIKNRNQLFLNYQPFAKFIAGQMNFIGNSYFGFEDILSNAYLGLFDAISKYDEKYFKKIKFTTYATYRIRGAILDSQRKQDPASRLQRKSSRKVEEAIENFETKKKKKFEENFKLLPNITEEDIERYYEVKGLVIHSLFDFLDSHKGDIKKEAFYEIIEDPNSIDIIDFLDTKRKKDIVNHALTHLTEREFFVIYGLFFRQETGLNLGIEIGLTESRISQLKTKAIKKLKRYLSKFKEFDDDKI